MRTVALISNWKDERCGNAQYGRNLFAELEKEFKVIKTLPMSFDLQDSEAIVINWCDTVVPVDIPYLVRVRDATRKVILIVQNSRGENRHLTLDDLEPRVDLVTAHEPIAYYNIPVRFKHVPHGIPQVPVSECYLQDEIGSAGFALSYKRMDVVAKAAAYLGIAATLITPVHALEEPSKMFREWNDLAHGYLNLITDWMPEKDVIKRLSQCAMNMYCSDDDTGQSGSVGMLLAARRPTIVLRGRKVRTFYPYEDEIYFVNTDQEAYETAKFVFERIYSGLPVKIPDRVLHDYGWTRTGKMYREAINNLWQM